MNDTTALNAFDFSTIESMDPSVGDGYRVIYERECHFELRVHDEIEPNGTLEAIKVKVLLLGEDSNPQALRIELSSENDLFFAFMHTMNEEDFENVQNNQQLKIDFVDYPNVLIRLLNRCINEPDVYIAVYVMHPQGKARLDFIQNMEYKFVDLLSLDFIRSPEEIVQDQITYRYNAMKSRLRLMEARLNDINTLVKSKNPALLLQIQKANPMGGGGVGSSSANMTR